ncbi:choice-of-anchor I family protein [Halalkalibacter sp. AB-rgal2]|uniref:choice-of-anchor I family protein n=1 Tax=Halalkalibacter sp. AB-rgal2 TaxID=3242695 RepID=UPI00359CF7F9
MANLRLFLASMLVVQLLLYPLSSQVVALDEGLSPTKEIQLELIGRYDSGAGFNQGGAEIVTFDRYTKQAFIVNGAHYAIDIVDLSTIGDVNLLLERKGRIQVSELDLGAGFQVGDITSVAIHPSGDFIAFSVPAEPRTDYGRVVLAYPDGKVITHVEVGALPDMVTFSPNGEMILVANEGEPNDAYTIDPEGSVTIIDVSDGPHVMEEHVVTVGFSQLKAEQIDEQVRIFGPGADAAKDFEPEYIVVSPDSKVAYVSLQENNAIATLNLETKQFDYVHGLGFKDHSLLENALDASDRDGEVAIKSWPVLGMYQPDGIDLLERNGTRYIVTANEGDARDYDGFSEELRAKNVRHQVALNADYYQGFSQAELDEMVANGVFNDEQLGRLRITSEMGKNEHGEYEALYSFGARSFSIWDASTMELVFDSGSEFERVVLHYLRESHFNANHTENTGETRSDDKGPEPEDVKIGVINEQYYAFIGLERVGGIIVYNVTDPHDPKLVTYYNSRDFTKDPASGQAGDLGTEGLMFVEEADSPTGKPLLLAANEVSGTMSIYEVSTINDEEHGLFELTIMHTNDTHAHLDQVPRRITAIRSIREEVQHSLLLDAGDVFSGTLFFNQYLGQADLEFMNMASYDAMVPGNHEFDKGPQVLADFIKNASFPFVSANINYSREPVFNDLFIDQIGSPGKEGRVYPAIVKEFNGERVGIFGLTTEDTAFIANPGAHIKFEDYLKKAEETVQRLQDEGVNKIIALTHLGYRYDEILAKQVEGIDIVVGGHSHTLLEEPVVFLEHTEPTLVVQAKEYGEYLGRLDVEFDEEGVLQSWNGTLIKVDEQNAEGQFKYEEDSIARERLAELQQPIEELKQKVVGQTAVFLDGEREHIRTQETNLGNLIADGMLVKAKESVDAQIALQNSGGIRASIAEGGITLGDVLTVLPYANTLVTLELTGEEIMEALELSVSSIEDGHGRFLQVAGLRFYFDRNEPAFQRVFRVEVETEKGYEPIKLDHTYTVATNAFAADGGDGYTMFKQAQDEGRMTELFIPDYDVFTDYLDQIGTVQAPYDTVEGRIVEGAEEDFDFDRKPLPDPKEPIEDSDSTSKDDQKKKVIPVAGDGGEGPSEYSEDNQLEAVKEGSLPNTATNMYSWFILGLMFVMTGVCGLMVYRRVRIS